MGRGVDWLFPVDDDELLHFGEPWESVVARVPPSADCIVVRNLEAANKPVPKALMDRAMQSSWFKSSRFKKGRGKGARGARNVSHSLSF